MLDGLHRDVTSKKKLEVDSQFIKHRVHQLGETSGQPQLLRDADLVIKHLLDTGAGQDDSLTFSLVYMGLGEEFL